MKIKVRLSHKNENAKEKKDDLNKTKHNDICSSRKNLEWIFKFLKIGHKSPKFCWSIKSTLKFSETINKRKKLIIFSKE